MKKHILLATAAAFAITPALAQQTQDQQPGQDQQLQTQTQPPSGQAGTQPLAGGDRSFDEVMQGDELNGQDFVRLAAMGDLFEIESARVAEQQAESDEVRQFAEKLIQDHRQAAQDLASAAEDAGVQVAILDRMDTVLGDAGGTTPTTGTAPAAGGTADTTTTGTVGATGTAGTAGSADRPATSPGATGTTGSTGSAGTPGTTGAGGTGATATAPGATGAGMGATAMLDSEHQQKLGELRGLSGAEFDRRFMEMQIEAHEQAISLFERYSEKGDEEALKSHVESTLPDLKTHLEEAQSISEDLG